MKRREVLKASGLAAMVDVGAAARSAAGRTGDAAAGGDAEAGGVDDAATGDTTLESFLARLPPPDAPADGRGYDAAFARRFDADHLPDPELLAGADAHASLVAGRATVTLGFGGPDREAAAEYLTGRGYRRDGRVAGRPVYERRGRRRHRTVLPTDDAVLVAAGPERRPAAALLDAVAGSERSASPWETHPPVRTAADLLAVGTAVGIELRPGLAAPRVAGVLRSAGRAGRPLVAGQRLAVRGDRVAVRSVAIYATRTTAGRALRKRPPDGPGGTATRDGRAVVRDATVPAADLLPEGVW